MQDRGLTTGAANRHTLKILHLPIGDVLTSLRELAEGPWMRTSKAQNGQFGGAIPLFQRRNRVSGPDLLDYICAGNAESNLRTAWDRS